MKASPNLAYVPLCFLFLLLFLTRLHSQMTAAQHYALADSFRFQMQFEEALAQYQLADSLFEVAKDNTY